MERSVKQLSKEVDKIDLADICSAWQWLIEDAKSVILVSSIGDMFLLWKDNCIYWLQADSGLLTKVANSTSEFEELLSDEDKVDEWFLPLLVEKLINAGKILKDSEVYSCKVMAILGGEFSVENIDPVNISVHFAFTGQICEQIRNLPDGTKVNIRFKPNGV